MSIPFSETPPQYSNNVLTQALQKNGWNVWWKFVESVLQHYGLDKKDCTQHDDLKKFILDQLDTVDDKKIISHLKQKLVLPWQLKDLISCIARRSGIGINDIHAIWEKNGDEYTSIAHKAQTVYMNIYHNGTDTRSRHTHESWSHTLGRKLAVDFNNPMIWEFVKELETKLETPMCPFSTRFFASSHNVYEDQYQRDTFRARARVRSWRQVLHNREDLSWLLDMSMSHRTKSEKPSATYLDVGCASGSMTKCIGEMCGFTPQTIYGTDIEKWGNFSFTEAEVSSNFAKSHFKYMQKDGKIPYENQTMNLITILQVLHHVNLEQRGVLVKELARILKPNGILIVREHNVPTHTHEKERISILLDMHHKLLECVIDDKHSDTFDQNYFAQYDCLANWIMLMQREGFIFVSCSDTEATTNGIDIIFQRGLGDDSSK